jgi:N-acetylglutamate synthase-like GNAT family acetyltransferase
VRVEPQLVRGNLLVRTAQPSDAAEIKSLYAQLLQNSRGMAVEPQRLAAIADDPSNVLVVVECGGKLVATALLCLCLDPMFGSQPFSIIENVVVDAAYRKRGCGRALFEAIERVALEADCSKVMLLSDHFRSDAHGFFVSMGYSKGTKCGFVKYRRNM